MRVVGFLAGAGSLLREAQDAGCRVVGNVDSRPYYERVPWLWSLNFDAPFFKTREEIEEVQPPGWFGAHVALGHPPCGKFSRLGNSGARVERFNEDERAEWHAKRRVDRGLLPLFVDLVNRFKPRTFAFDNLPRMFGAISEGEWSELLPRYRMTFLQIWNWDYGSPQRRKRLWVIGSRSKKAFVFKPPRSRIPGPEDTWSAIQDLPWQPWVDQPGIDHVHHLVGSKPIGGYWSRTSGGERWAIQDFIDYAAGFMSLPPGLLWPYMNNHGRYVHKPSRARPAMGKPARVLSGNETINHPLTGWPLTIRERARIMGWPDGFRLSDPPEHSLDRTTITKMVLVTGRAVPSEFPRFLIPQLMDHASSI